VRNNKGMTMLELVFALVIISLVAINFYGFQQSFSSKTRGLGQYNTAASLNIKYMELARNIFTNPGTPIPVSNLPVQIIPTAVDKQTFTTSISVEDLTQANNYLADGPLLFKITVSTAWSTSQKEVLSLYATQIP
jgi:prepilin-type N-terminal cleavage/methylation domain-containing protein